MTAEEQEDLLATLGGVRFYARLNDKGSVFLIWRIRETCIEVFDPDPRNGQYEWQPAESYGPEDLEPGTGRLPMSYADARRYLGTLLFKGA